ncbi:MAG: LysR family transcriptional regulator [Pseudomonadales bacterium]|nr:LysR family transcriptional regulator [Pseudomonadales bacterium]
MDYNKARTFVEVVDSGSISAAAGRLKRTQQAISLQIQTLEKELGISLLVREGRSIVLTEGGEHLYQEFKAQFIAMENSVQQYKSDRSSASGVIRIGVWVDLSSVYFPEMLATFSKLYPLVKFEIQTAVDHELEAMLIENKIDLSHQIFVDNSKLLFQANTFTCEFIPVVSKGYATLSKLPTDIVETLEMPLIDIYGDYSVYRVWIKKNARHLLSVAEKKMAVVCVTSHQALKNLVLEGLGFGLLPRNMIQAELSAGDLILLPLSGDIESVRVDMDIVYKRNNSLGHIHHAFIQHLLDNKIV